LVKVVKLYLKRMFGKPSLTIEVINGAESKPVNSGLGRRGGLMRSAQIRLGPSGYLPEPIRFVAPASPLSVPDSSCTRQVTGSNADTGC